MPTILKTRPWQGRDSFFSSSSSPLSRGVQLPVRTRSGLWKYPNMLRTWVWSWGPALAVWWSSSCSWEPSSLLSRRGEWMWKCLCVCVYVCHLRDGLDPLTDAHLQSWVLLFLHNRSKRVNLSPSHLAVRVYWEKSTWQWEWITTRVIEMVEH